jgi:hypothetical protein
MVSSLKCVDAMLDKEKELVQAIQLRTGFRVYLCLLKLKTASTKDIQKAMKFPTSGQAKYHLKKLVELGLAKDEGGTTFRVVERRFGILRFCFKARNSILPMSLFYCLFFAILTVFLLLRLPSVEVALLGLLVVSKEAADTYSFFGLL